MRLITLLGLLLVAHAALATIEVRSASRTIEFKNSLTRSTTKYTFLNSGSSAVDTFEIAVESDHLAYLSIRRENKNLKPRFLRDNADSSLNFAIYSVRLAKAIESGSSVDISVFAVHSHRLVALPAEIEQSQRQFVVYHGSHFVPSAYPVLKQTTTVTTPSSTILSVSEREPSSRSGDTVTLGPYTNVAALDRSPLRVHFENNAAFLTATNLLKEVEVSHWGNVAVEEHVSLVHTGARLKGNSFSRIDYQHGVSGNSVRGFVQYLPGDATGIYYRDVIGNISTSHVFPTDDNRIKFELETRFILFGGWKTTYYTGYNLPASNYLSINGSRYTLSINFGTDIGDIDIENFEMRFILPEGATDIKVDCPFAVQHEKESLRFTYLDIQGRPVVALKHNNVVLEHYAKQVRVSYNFSSTQVYHEPLLLIVSYLFFFLAVMIFMRVDFSISRSSGKENLVSEAALQAIAALQALYQERSDSFGAYDGAIDRLLKDKVAASHSSALKTFDSALSSSFNRGVQLQNRLSSVDRDLSAIASNIEQREKERVALKKKLGQIATKYVGKSLNAEEFERQAADVKAQIRTLDDEIATLSSHLSAE